jgi:hypothetical protein
VAFNGSDGVVVLDAASTGDGIGGNAIFANGGLGIDLGGDGVTRNNAAGHVGPNDFQNFPVLTSAVATASGTVITGTLDSNPFTAYDVELFAGTVADPSGYGQGQTYLGVVAIMTDATGHAGFTFTSPGSLLGFFITATATDRTAGPPGTRNDTSEFAADLAAVPLVAPPTVQSVVVNDGSAQRSMVGSLTITFSTQVDIGPGAFTLVQTSSGVSTDVSGVVRIATARTTDGRTVAALTFAGGWVTGGSLADGRYVLTIHSNLIHDHLLRTSLGSDTVSHFFRLFGDVNGDGRVDATDLAAFQKAYRSRRGMPNYRGYFDSNADGLIDVVDYYQFLRRYGTVLAP